MKDAISELLKKSSSALSVFALSMVEGINVQGVFYPLDWMFSVLDALLSIIRQAGSYILGDVVFLVNLVILLSSVAVVLSAYLKYLEIGN